MSSVVDLAQLEMMTGGDAELAAEALGIFRSQAELWGQLLDSSAATAQWADACHAIKGAARSVGAMDLGEACGRAEELGRRVDVSAVQASVAVSEVKDRLGEAIEALAHVEHRLMVTRTFKGLRLA